MPVAINKKAMGGVANQRVICVIHPNPSAGSVTFIRAHLERLPAKVKLLYGGNFPRYRAGDVHLLSQSPLSRLLRSVVRRILKLPANRFERTALKRFLRRENVDVVLAEIGPVGVETMDVCEDADIPLLVYLRGADVYSGPIIERFGDRYPELFEKTGAIFVVSRDMEQYLKTEYRIPGEKLHYNPSGVDIALFQGADPAHAPPLFVAVGRFSDNKGPYLTLLAFEKTAKRFPDSRLVMIGDGPLWETCKHLAHALGINSAVEFLGAQPHTEVAATMRRARAFVQHSIRTSNGAEGTPNALKEAGASGLPVVATRLGGIPEIVIHGKTGFLVDEGDVAGMAEYMTQLAKDPYLAARLGEAARDWIRSEFAMEKHIENLWCVIESAIRDHGRGG